MDRNVKVVQENLEAYRQHCRSRAAGIASGTVTTAETHPLVARMNEVMTRGRYDRDEDGCNLLAPVLIGGERFRYQVIRFEGDALIWFFSWDRDSHSRRLLVTAEAEYWLELDGRAVPHWGKYAAASVTVLARRAYQVIQSRGMARAA